MSIAGQTSSPHFTLTRTRTRTRNRIEIENENENENENKTVLTDLVLVRLLPMFLKLPSRALN